MNRLVLILSTIVLFFGTTIAQTPPGWVRPNSLDSSHVKTKSLPVSKLKGTTATVGKSLIVQTDSTIAGGIPDSAAKAGAVEIADSTSGGAARATVSDSTKKVDTVAIATKAFVRDSAGGVSEADIGTFIDSTQLDTIQNAHKAVIADSSVVSGTSGAVSSENPDIYGDLNVWGVLRVTNNMSWLDTTALSCARADTFLYIPVPDTFKGSWDADSVSSMHPGVVAIPGGWNGWEYWAVFTKGQDSQEDPYLRVSHDAIHWYRFGWGPNAGDSLADPIWNEDTIGAAYLSDPDLFMGGNSILYMTVRVVNNSDSETVYITGSSNGQTWSEPVRILPWYASPTGTIWDYLSPALWTDTGGSVGMWCVNNTADDTTYFKKWMIDYWTSPHPESMMTKVGPVTGWGPIEPYFDSTAKYTIGANPGDTFPTGSYGSIDHDGGSKYPLWRPWHIDVISRSGSNKAVLIAAQGTVNDIYALYFGQTDNGRRLQICHTPILDTALDGRWDASVYRSTGWWENRGGQDVLRILYSGMDTVFIGGSTEATSRLATGLTTLYFGTSSNVSANSIDSSHIKDGSIIGADIKTGAIGTTQIATDGVGAADIVASAVGTSEIANGSIANADLSTTAVDSNVIPAASISATTDINWTQEGWYNWNVEARTAKKTDSVFMFADLGIGAGTTHQSYLFYDSINTNTNKKDTIYCYADLPYAMHIDSISYWYYATGSTSSDIDTVTIYGPATASAGTPVADSAYNGTNTDADAATTLTRVNFVINKDMVKGDRLRMEFITHLNAANAIIGVRRISVLHKRKQ